MTIGGVAKSPFGPELDEYFHPTHTKQDLRSIGELESGLIPDLEELARTLNSRVRASFANLKRFCNQRPKLVSTRDKYLPPLQESSFSTSINPLSRTGRAKYSLSVEPLHEDSFYSVRRDNGTLELVLNKDHAFFE